MTTVDEDKPPRWVNRVMLWLVRVVVCLVVYYFALSYCIDAIAWYRSWKGEVTGAFAFLTIVNPVTLLFIINVPLLAVLLSLGRLAAAALVIGCLQPLVMTWWFGSM